MKQTLLALLCFVATALAQEDKHVIGAMPNEGFFSSFVSVVNSLMWAEANGKTPVIYWDEKSLFHNGSGNSWEYYFEPVSSLSYHPREGLALWDACPAPDSIHLFSSFLKNVDEFHGTLRAKAKQTIDRFIRVLPHITEKVNRFYQERMTGKTNIGIHFRGTDFSPQWKVKEMVASQCIAAAKEAAKRYPGEVQFFIATDDEALLAYAKKQLPRVIHCDSQRSVNGQPIHRKGSGFDRRLLGEELLIEGLLLTKCDYFVHSHSSVPIAVMLLNPELKTEFISPMPAIYKHVYGLSD